MSQQNVPVGVTLQPTGINASITGLTAALASTVFFTAQNAGIYQIEVLLNVDSTDGAGTLTLTGSSTAPNAKFPTVVAPNLASGTGVNGFMPPFPIRLAAGDTVSFAVAAGSLGTTTYDVNANIRQLL